MEEHDLDLCWAALAVAILDKRPKTPEAAFEKLERPHRSPTQTKAEVQRMIKLLEDGYTYREIGELYGLSKGAVHKRITRLTKKMDHTLERVDI